MFPNVLHRFATAIFFCIFVLLSAEASAQPLACTGFCDNGGYCENADCPNPVCYSPDSIQSLLLCGPCPDLCGPSFGFGECVGGSYCGPVPPDCLGVCLVDTQPLSQVICGGAFQAGCGVGTCIGSSYCDDCRCYVPGGVVSQLFCDDCERKLDHFKCYKAKDLKNPPFQPTTATLVDQFEQKITQVLKPALLCNPVDKNGEGINDPTAHLTCYKIKDDKHQAKFPGANVQVENQFGTLQLNAKKAALVCIPSTKLVLP